MNNIVNTWHQKAEKLVIQMTLEEKSSLCAGEDFWHSKGIDRLHIPSMMMCDGPHGLRKQEDQTDHLGMNESVKAVCFPSAAGLAASFDRSLLSRLGTILSNECQAENVGILLGPGMNIKRSPLCGRNFEYFSEDPCVTGELASAYVDALQEGGIATCAKHFAANNQETLRMVGSSEVDERTFHEIYLAGFETMVKKSHPHSMMCSYNRINGTFSSENHVLLTEILRERWRFDGCIVTDWGAVKDRVKGLNAGLDLEMPGPGGNAEKIIHAVKNNELDESVLNEAVINVLTLVTWVQEHRLPNAIIDYQKDHDAAGEIAAECGVLLKNDNQILPLSKSAKVAFIGAFASSPRYQGSGSSHINAYHVTSALEAAKNLSVAFAEGYHANTSQTDATLLQEAVALASVSEAAVIFAGLPGSSESEGFDRHHMDIPANQNALIEAVAAVNPNTVVVLENGSPILMPWADKVPAILEMYLGGENVGTAEVKLLFGDVNPSGKLAETFPLALSHNPSYLNFPGEGTKVDYREGIYIGYRYYDKKEWDVLFPFGHGLSYTSFTYSDLKLNKTSLKDTDSLTLSFRLKNTGSHAGKEVVQLYISDLESTVGRPVRELKDFCKIALAPEEETEVTFTLDKKSFSYYEPRINGWYVESGVFRIEIGTSSRDIRLSAEAEVIGTADIPITYDKFTPVGIILKSAKGTELLGTLLMHMQKVAGDVDVNSDMGDGAVEMGQAMLNEMPLLALAGFSGMSDRQLNELVQDLNHCN